MKIRLFVTSSAVFFAAWLGITFFYQVPEENYPQLGRGSLPISAKAEKPEEKKVTKISLSFDGKPEQPMAARN